MIFDEQGAYEAFLDSGKISDYLDYIDLKQQAAHAAGEAIAYHDRGNRAAGAAGGGI